MSAVDFAARGMAVRASALNPLPFAALGQAQLPVQLPATLQRITSSGHATPGRGAACYVCDDKATPALRAAFPGAVFMAADGRYFRLLGDDGGFVTPEQLGCPAYAPGVNAQPFIQTAVDYANAVGLAGVRFPQRKYELWAPARTDAFADQSRFSGCFIVVNKPTQLLGLSGRRTMLHCRGPNGGDITTDYQVGSQYGYADVIWRGHGITTAASVYSSRTRPDDADLSHLVVRDIILFADTVPVALDDVNRQKWPARVSIAGGLTWDTSMKGINMVGGYQTGHVLLENVDIIGFLGECLYGAAAVDVEIIGRNLTMKHSGGQAINPSACGRFDIDGLYAENISVAWEGWGGKVTSRLVNAYFKDVLSAGFTGWNGVLSNADYWTVTRADNTLPTLHVDVTMEGSATVGVGTTCYIGNNVTGKLRLIDMSLGLVPSAMQGSTAGMVNPIVNNDLDVTLVVNRRNGGQAVRFTGLSAAITAVAGDGASVTYTAANHGLKVGRKVDIFGFTPTGYNASGTVVTAVTASTFTIANATTAAVTTYGTVYPFGGITNNTIRLKCVRTQYARDNGFYMQGLLQQSGDIGDGNFIYVRGFFNSFGGSGSSVINKSVAVIDEGLVSEGGTVQTTAFDPTTTPTPDWSSCFVRASTFSGGAGVNTVNLPAIAAYPHGAEIVIQSSGGATNFVELSDGAKRAMLAGGKAMKFKANKLLGKWDMVGANPVLSATASIAITSTALNAVSGPYSVPLTGCRPWHRAAVVPPSLTTGFAITAVRADTDAVKFWVTNVDGANPATLAALTYTAKCWVAES